ncbi:hypothetical protein E2C01_025202 [Portunus trituberculatus]|uniref:Uncharacterized protein n=1 Tax=Portunus trituberculatus TaxID=210409 RepID=A0A5B7ECQ9_PORTR|nr:hypothetical protein [Portunus trituberculatus]
MRLRLRSSGLKRFKRKPCLGSGVVVSFFLPTASSGLFAIDFLGAGEKRLGELGLFAGESGRRFMKECGTDDLLPGSLDDSFCLERKLKGRKVTSGPVSTNSSSNSGSSNMGSSSNTSRSEMGAAVVASVGNTEVGLTVLVLPGKTEERVLPNLNLPGLLVPGKAPGLLALNRNPGELPLTLVGPKRPGREDPLGPPGLDVWKRNRIEDGATETCCF